MNGVLVLDKPRGPTSFDLVARVRRAAAERRVGHAGTLDPMASGVLVICLGEATKLVPYLMDADKEYRATVRLGVSTDTDDADVGAKVIAQAPPEALAALREEQVRAALAEQAGLRRQVPPRYSALKIEGERLYDLARLAQAPAETADLEEMVAAKARDVQIHELRVEEVALPEVTFFIRCGKGTYVRSVARDLGERLGVGGHLSALRRLRVGRFTVEQATPLVHEEGGKHGIDRFDGPPRLFTPAQALAHLPAVQVPREIADRVRNGQLAAVAEAAARLDGDPGWGSDRGGEVHAVVLDEAGDLAAVLVRRRGDDGWRISRGFVRSSAA